MNYNENGKYGEVMPKKTEKKIIRAYPKRMSVSVPLRHLEPEYDRDFYLWTQSQATLLRNEEFKHLDIEHLVEEIESLGISDLRSLKSHLIILLLHLLKKKYQPRKKTASWDRSISNALMEIDLILEDSPSLRSKIAGELNFVYRKARERAAEETKLKLSHFPEECEWKIAKAFSKARDRAEIRDFLV